MAMPAIRTGQSYLNALKDGRSIYIDGRQVSDVTTDPAFCNTVASYARLYEFQSKPESCDLMTFPDPVTGEKVNKSWMLPKKVEDLRARRAAIEAWSELSFGMLGRSPDHVATSLGGMIAGLSGLEGTPGLFAERLLKYFEKMRAEDRFVSYVINDPQAGKTQSVSEKGDLIVSVVQEDNSGITVRGAKMLGTSSIMADELIVGSIAPLKPGEERFAATFAVPLATKGVRLMSRKSYEASASNGFDYPLAYHFDENDAVVWFEDVHVPWERVFTYGDVTAAHAIWHRTPAHSYHNYQSQIRFSVKLRFLAGLTRHITEINGSNKIPAVQGKLARLARQANIIRGLVIAAETEFYEAGGYVMPDPGLVYTSLSLAQQIYPEFITEVRDLCGGGVIMLPSSVEDFSDPDMRRMIAATQLSAIGTAEERVRAFRLAWDAIGSEFASRHTQYEMFYGGANRIVDANVFRKYDWAAATRLVDKALAMMPLPGGLATGAAE
ncbi:4-hydroxyphenylacetate 3-hydroxylase family protein [Celeribacter sp.]|uniref:4-hydroxyphenylacetate 3-hydroxylase family protein n=1 Tax=Celeribacter sp. TaxID=1890673 RepID=UPI003A91D1AA